MRRIKKSFKFTKAVITITKTGEEIIKNYDGEVSKKRVMTDFIKENDDFVEATITTELKEETYVQTGEEFMKHGTLIEVPKTDTPEDDEEADEETEA